MGSYTFKWEHPEANEVFVTGTFDDWGKTEKLEKVGDVFEKTVDFDGKDKILYKFVVDNNWTHNHTAATETDEHYNVNNVLFPHDLKPHPTSQMFSSAATGSTTAALAGQVPKEEGSKSDVPGAFPETPAAEPKEPDAFSVNPIPQTDGPGNPIKLAPGEKVPDPSTLTKNTINSTVTQDEPETFSANPIPASAGAGNPIHLAPGEKVPDPSTISGNTIGSTATTDKESYEKGTGGSVLPNSSGNSTAGSGMFGVPPVSSNMIPESSLPLGKDAPSEADPGVTVQSAAPESTTSALAGAVPLEAKSSVPEVVTESQKEAHVDPEASANSEAVVEKSEVEQELLKKVHEEPATNEGGTSTGEIAEAITGGVAAAGAAGAAVYASATGTKETNGPDVVKVPDVVKESIAKAHAGPEATTNPEAVAEKGAMEQELEKKVKVEDSTGEPAPTSGPAGGLSDDALSSSEPLKSSSEPKLAAPATPSKPTISRDVSPKGGPAVPAIGGASEAGPATPKKDTPKPAADTPASKKTTDATTDTPDSKADKKKKRRSIFAKLKKIFD